MRIKLAIAIQCACLLVATGANAQNVNARHNFDTYSDALSYLLGAGFANCQIADLSDPDLTFFGFVNGGGDDPGDVTALEDQHLVEIVDPGPIGPNLSRHCSPNTNNSNLFGGSVLGGSMSSLQSTRTVSQFDLSSRRSAPCDPTDDTDCKEIESATVSNDFYQGSFTQSDSAFFSLVDDGDGVLDANVLIPFDGFAVFGQIEYENYRQSATRYEAEKDVDIFTAQLGALWNISDDGVVGFKGVYSTGQGVSPGPENVAVGTGFIFDENDNLVPGPVFTANFEDHCGVPRDGTVDTDDFGGSIFYQGALMENGFITAEFGASKSSVNYSNSLCLIDVTLDGSDLTTAFPRNEKAGIISGSPDVYGLSADLKTGYDWEYDGVVIGPRLSFNAWWESIDGYSETEVQGTIWVPTGASLRYEDQDISSIQTRLGFAVSKPFIFDRTTVVPFAQLDYIHEFANDQRAIKVSFVEDGRPDPFVFSFKTNPPDRDFFELRGGVVAEIFDGGVAYVEGRAFLANELIDSVGVTGGLRVAF